jgi:hypothetical protein
VKKSQNRASSGALLAKAAGVLLLAASPTLRAETLTGLVTQPKPSSRPAADSTVTVHDPLTGKTIAGPTTTAADGIYKIQVPKGAFVRVRAVWDVEASMPGIAVATVSNDPTLANIQLQPPRGSAETVWYQSGADTAKFSSLSAVATASELQTQEVSASGRYQFILGARSVDATAFRGIEKMDIFDSKVSPTVVHGLRIAELQFQTTKTFPTYGQLNQMLGPDLPQPVYWQMLGFLAPKDKLAKDDWNLAIQKATDKNAGEVVIWARKLDTEWDTRVPDEGA